MVLVELFFFILIIMYVFLGIGLELFAIADADNENYFAHYDCKLVSFGRSVRNPGSLFSTLLMSHFSFLPAGAVCSPDANALCSCYLLRFLDHRPRIVCGILERSPGQKLLSTLRLWAGKQVECKMSARKSAFLATVCNSSSFASTQCVSFKWDHVFH